MPLSLTLLPRLEPFCLLLLYVLYRIRLTCLHPEPHPLHSQAFRAALALLQVTPEQLAVWRTDRLQALLLYHVLPAVVDAASVPETDTERTTIG